MELTLWRDDVVLARAVRAAGQHHDTRTRLYLRVEHDGVAGFGEVAPQPKALHGDPGVQDVLDELTAILAPQLLAGARREGTAPSWRRLARFAGPRAASPAAVALVEMALVDRELRAAGETATSLWPRVLETPIQATVSALDDEPWSVGAASRVRVKTAPGPISASARERLAGLDVGVLLDFNASASDADDVVAQALVVGAACDLVAVEQPFAAGNLAEHAALAHRLDVAVSLDEGIRSTRDLAQVARYSAATMVCVKPARVGGLANARTMFARAEELGLRAYLGGFFESAYARSVHRVLAEAGVREPSDIGPVARADGVPEVVAVAESFGVTPSAAVLAGPGRALTGG